MPKSFDRIPLLSPAPGTERHVALHRYGEPGARPKVYLQAAIHADELPGMLVAHHLVRLFDEADRDGRVRGEILLVPAANPIGLAQRVNGGLLGRYDLDGGGNFNRAWPNLTEAVAERIAESLGTEAEANVERIRAAMRAALGDQTPTTDLSSLKLTLGQLACDADIVLDLHCDSEALVHVYMSSSLWPDGADLSAEVGSRATLLSEPSGGDPFEEAWSSPWAALRRRFEGKPIPLACFSSTVELRGESDVEDHLAQHDAGALYRFLTRRHVIDGDPGPLPEAQCEATPLAGVDVIKSPATGIVAYQKRLGERVKAGETIAELVDPTAEHAAEARRPIASRADGILFTRRRTRFVRPGEGIAKVAGVDPLSHRKGRLLED
jgi:hypothetical protein